jgi:hypothetical protein
LKIKTLLIVIHLDPNIIKSDLELRHFLVDTIESRGWGEVIDETSSPKMMEIVLEVSKKKKVEDDLQDILIALGFNNYDIQDISM